MWLTRATWVSWHSPHAGQDRPGRRIEDGGEVGERSEGGPESREAEVNRVWVRGRGGPGGLRMTVVWDRTLRAKTDSKPPRPSGRYLRYSLTWSTMHFSTKSEHSRQPVDASCTSNCRTCLRRKTITFLTWALWVGRRPLSATYAACSWLMLLK